MLLHAKIDIKRILLELESLPEYSDQLALQGVDGVGDYLYGSGRGVDLKHKESDFVVPNFPTLEYTNSVIKELKLFRTRIMRLEHKTCYTYHRDPTKRLHIPLITNDDCFMVIEDAVYRYPADGNYYLIDTTKKHTFVNASFETRIHLVGCTKDC